MASINQSAQTFFDHPRWVLVTHRQADGDALGSLLGFKRMLSTVGVEVIAYHPEQPSPRLRAFDTDELTHELPPSVKASLGSEWLVCALDCGDQDRICAPEMRTAPIAIQYDHHNGNPHYADINIVDVDASSTAEMMWVLGSDLLQMTSNLNEDGTPAWTKWLGDPLWVGLVTDTGGFGYEKAGVRSHQMAASLIGAGVQPAWWRAELYGRSSLALMQARAKTVEQMKSLHGGRVVVGTMTMEMLHATGLDVESVYDTADDMRDIEGVYIAVGGRPLGDGQPIKYSLRTNHDDINLTPLAQSFGGGGHMKASGFLWHGTVDELVSEIERRTEELYGDILNSTS